jgi:U1 small nuclear ribonucleoprotein
VRFQYLQYFKPPEELKPLEKHDTPAEVKQKKKEKSKAKHERKLQSWISKWKPSEDEKAIGKPSRTIFVGRLDYDAKEDELKRVFNKFGPVEDCRVVTDPKTGKSRGYGFVVFESSRDVKGAIQKGNGLRILNRRVVCDVDRGRTDPAWKPRRLGGGLGDARLGLKKKKDRSRSRSRSQNRSGFRREELHSGRDYRGGGGPRGGVGYRGNRDRDSGRPDFRGDFRGRDGGRGRDRDDFGRGDGGRDRDSRYDRYNNDRDRDAPRRGSQDDHRDNYRQGGHDSSYGRYEKRDFFGGASAGGGDFRGRRSDDGHGGGYNNGSHQDNARKRSRDDNQWEEPSSSRRRTHY